MPVSRKKYILVLLAAAAVLALLLLLSFAAAPPQGGGADGDEYPLRISEYMANNKAYPNADGIVCDWIEIENASDRDFNVSGYRLTDDVTQAKFAFPMGTVIPARGQIVVWCVPERSGGLYAPFSLKKQGGETILLMNSANTVLDRTDTLRSRRNLSFVRLFDGSFTVSDAPTPGYPNDAAGREAYLASVSPADASLRLSEIMTGARLYTAPDGSSCDWIEVENVSSRSLDVSGMHLSDKEGEGRYTFPEGTILPPGGYAVIWCSGETGAGAAYAPFRLTRAGETVILTDKNGGVLDRITVPALDHDVSYARVSGTWTMTTRAAPGWPNDPEGYAAWASAMGYGGVDVRITEISARNVSGHKDADGDRSDWVELYNAGSGTVSLEGWYLSDKAEKPTRWRIPQVSLAPGESTVIYASGKNRTEGQLHTNFSLSVGETVTLTTPIGMVADEAEVIFTAEDHSQVRTADGWTESAVPTPGRQGG